MAFRGTNLRYLGVGAGTATGDPCRPILIVSAARPARVHLLCRGGWLLSDRLPVRALTNKDAAANILRTAQAGWAVEQATATTHGLWRVCQRPNLNSRREPAFPSPQPRRHLGSASIVVDDRTSEASAHCLLSLATMASPPNGVYFPSLDECLKGNKLVLYVNGST